MIVIDFNQVVIANLHQQLKGHTNAKLDVVMLKHMTLNSIRAFNFQHRDQYGGLVIACDSRKTWRKDRFPYYKIRRKQSRDKSELDWTTIFEALGELRNELKEFFPYRVIEVDGAEADDVIASLCHRFGNTDEKILIISEDQDFLQLLRYKNVSILQPRKDVLVQNRSSSNSYSLF